MAWYDNLKTPKIKISDKEHVSRVPEGIWVKCPSCSEIVQSKVYIESLKVCPECSHHGRLNSWEWVNLLTDSVDEGPVFKEIDSMLVSTDPLEFFDKKNYKDRLKDSQLKTSAQDAFLSGYAQLGGIEYALGVFEFQFMGGSMGSVVGEKITRLYEKALDQKCPVVVVNASGGARMQEGILSLMQMAKTTSWIEKLRQMGIPYISILTDPTTGGVAASFALLGDIILAEPNALIGFAGPRVIEQTIRQSLPKGFQRSEFLLSHGMVDRVVSRHQLPSELKRWLTWLSVSQNSTKNIFSFDSSW